MNYEEYLESLDLESLKILAESHRINYINAPYWEDEKDFLKAEISRVLIDHNYLEEQIVKLDEYQKNLMKIIFFSDEPVDQDDIVRKFNILYGKEHNARNIIDTLWRRGLLMKFDIHYKNRPYISLISEVKPILSRLVVQEIIGQTNLGDLKEYINSNPSEFMQDIYVFLSYVNNNEVKLTAKNQIFKKTAHKIEDLFIFKSDFMDDEENEYTTRFLFINNFLYMIDLINYVDGKVVLNRKKVEKWLRLKLSDKIKAIVNFLETFHIGSKREIGEAIDKIKFILLSSYNTPISLNLFEEMIKKYHANMNYSYLYSCHKKILNYLILIGLAEILIDNERNLFVRLNEYGWKLYSNLGEISNKEEEYFYIQPNFEVISTINLNPLLRWRLDSFCDLVKIEKTIHYFITKASIYRALNNYRIEDILTFFKRYSKSGIPQNVEYTIKGWGLSYGNVYLMDATLLRCKTPELANEISSIPGIQESIIEKITDKDLIINGLHSKDILDILIKKGYMARPYIIDSNNVSNQERDQYDFNDNNKQIDENIDLKQFTIDMKYLETNDHYKKTVMRITPVPGNEKDKSAGVRIFGPTAFQAKEIIEKAIAQKKPILIEYYDDSNETTNKIKIEPSKIQKKDTGWLVYGYNLQKEMDMVFDINNIQGIEFSNH